MVQQVRVIQRVGVLINGEWVWQDFELSASQAAAAAGNVQPLRQDDAVARAGRYTFDFGKFRGERVEDLDKYDLNRWLTYWLEEEKGGGEIGERLREAMVNVSTWLDYFERPAHMQVGKRRA